MKEYGLVKTEPALKKFQCQIHFFGKEMSGSAFVAYCMDGQIDIPSGQSIKILDLRHEAQLGTCSCCDYMQIRDRATLLIEESDVALSIINVKNECKGMAEPYKTKIIRKILKTEFVQKLYGAMLVLCRLVNSGKLPPNLASKKIVFMLVYKGTDDLEGEEAITEKYFKDWIRSELSDEIDVRMLSSINATKELQ